MEQTWVILRRINKYLETISLSPIKRFYPSAVAKYADVPLDTAFRHLIELVDQGELKLVWELRCPEYFCLRTLNTFEASKSDLDMAFCPKCGKDFEVMPEDFVPSFEINPYFRDYVRQEKKTSNSRLLQIQPS